MGNTTDEVKAELRAIHSLIIECFLTLEAIAARLDQFGFSRDRLPEKVAQLASQYDRAVLTYLRDVLEDENHQLRFVQLEMHVNEGSPQ